LLAGIGALILRGLLFAFVRDPALLVLVQLLDGVAAAVFGVLVPLTVADVTFGTGHFNFAQGIVGSATGIGASIFNLRSNSRRGGVNSMKAFIMACAAGVVIAIVGVAVLHTVSVSLETAFSSPTGVRLGA
jgi:hypothetical protein